MIKGNYKKADIDVVVLTYNHEKYIERSIMSILCQKTSYTFNVLIADDCSTDNTREIINKWVQKDERVILVGTERNLGSIENARNVIGYCQSDVLALCEGDDFWLDDKKIQLQMDFLNSNQDFGMVHGNVKYFETASGQLKKSDNFRKGIKFPSGDIFMHYLTNEKLFIYTATVLVKRELFIQSADYDLFEKNKWMVQDLPTWLELSRRTKIAYLDREMAAYQLGTESASRSRDVEYIYRFHQSVFNIRYYYWQHYSRDTFVKQHLDFLFSVSLLSDLKLQKSKKIWHELYSFKKQSNVKWNLKRWFQFLYLSCVVILRAK
jgi:glycosyltransferase involved in cell wall biosynthesis